MRGREGVGDQDGVITDHDLPVAGPLTIACIDATGNAHGPAHQPHIIVPRAVNGRQIQSAGKGDCPTGNGEGAAVVMPQIHAGKHGHAIRDNQLPAGTRARAEVGEGVGRNQLTAIQPNRAAASGGNDKIGSDHRAIVDRHRASRISGKADI